MNKLLKMFSKELILVSLFIIAASSFIYSEYIDCKRVLMLTVDLPEEYKAMDYNTPIRGYYNESENKVYIEFIQQK